MLRKIALLRLHAAWNRCVFVEREMGPRSFGGGRSLWASRSAMFEQTPALRAVGPACRKTSAAGRTTLRPLR